MSLANTERRPPLLVGDRYSLTVLLNVESIIIASHHQIFVKTSLSQGFSMPPISCASIVRLGVVLLKVINGTSTKLYPCLVHSDARSLVCYETLQQR
jgi:hypothetical protein